MHKPPVIIEHQFSVQNILPCCKSSCSHALIQGNNIYNLWMITRMLCLTYLKDRRRTTKYSLLILYLHVAPEQDLALWWPCGLLNGWLDELKHFVLGLQVSANKSIRNDGKIESMVWILTGNCLSPTPITQPVPPLLRNNTPLHLRLPVKF